MRPRAEGHQPWYDAGDVALYCGDCLDLLPAFAPESFDLVLTDPPYGVGYRGRFGDTHEPIAGDTELAWLRPAAGEMWRVLKPDSFAVSFYGWPHVERFVGAVKGAGFRLVSHLAFVKNVWGFGRFTRGQHETAFLLAKGKPPLPRRGISDVIEWMREPSAFHPNQKPVGALTPVLAAYAPDDGVVLDPFMGSGSTLRAAKDLGLSAVGIEIEQAYCDRAAGRLAQRVLFGPDAAAGA
jgi:adenine-specific DNA-methyltransferase